jgi:hypothetical protein
MSDGQLDALDSPASAVTGARDEGKNEQEEVGRGHELDAMPTPDEPVGG